jgi:flagellar hook-basal body complex protein FliE
MNVTDSIGKGYTVGLRTTNPLHYGDKPASGREADDVSGSFADMLNKAIGQVNDLQVDAENLSEKMIHEPESVDIHTVMIASQKAELALTFAKSVRDEAIRAYRELMNLR